MFRLNSLYNRMTAACNYYLDWSNVAVLFKSGTHRYSREQLLVRGGMISFATLTGFLGYYFNDSKKTNCSSLTLAIATSFAGFLLSHTVALYPLVTKRRGMADDCQATINAIRTSLKTLSPEKAQHFENEISIIMTSTQSDEKHSNATQTWGSRKRLLLALKDLVEQQSAHTPSPGRSFK